MLTLPPPASVGRSERRSRERRKADRRTDANASAIGADLEGAGFEGAAQAQEPRAAADDVETTGTPVFRSRGAGRGRRKTDRQGFDRRDPERQATEDGDGPVRLAKPHAPLVAQLIATELGFEQTRLRRRGSLEQAAELYQRKAERAKPSRGEA